MHILFTPLQHNQYWAGLIPNPSLGPTQPKSNCPQGVGVERQSEQAKRVWVELGWVASQPNLAYPINSPPPSSLLDLFPKCLGSPTTNLSIGVLVLLLFGRKPSCPEPTLSSTSTSTLLSVAADPNCGLLNLFFSCTASHTRLPSVRSILGRKLGL